MQNTVHKYIYGNNCKYLSHLHKARLSLFLVVVDIIFLLFSYKLVEIHYGFGLTCRQFTHFFVAFYFASFSHEFSFFLKFQVVLFRFSQINIGKKYIFFLFFFYYFQLVVVSQKHTESTNGNWNFCLAHSFCGSSIHFWNERRRRQHFYMCIKVAAT